MLAAYYKKTGQAKDVLKLGEFDKPVINSNEVLISLKASGINPSDIKKRQGWRKQKMDFPLVIPHSDGSGKIIKVGKNLSSEYLNKRVWIWTAQGGYNEKGRPYGTASEFIKLPITKFCELPDNLSYEEGACLGVPAMTAYNAVFSDGNVKNKTILIQGAGGAVGHFAVQFSKLSGANVIGSVGSEERGNHALSAGADKIVNRKDNNFVKNVLNLTNGKGVDRIIEIDFGENVNNDIKILKPNGIIASYSSTTKPNPTFPYYDLASKGCKINIIQSFNFSQQIRKKCCNYIKKLCSDNSLKISIGNVFQLKEIIKAHKMVEEKKTIGNIVLKI